jgi:Xaa-Pro aminopeptidase
MTFIKKDHHMLNEARQRTQNLQKKMQDLGIEVALFTEESSIAYLAGFWGYLGIEFGRPTMLVVYRDRESKRHN